MLACYKHTALVGVFVADSSRGRVLRGLGPGAEPTILYDLNREDRRRLAQGVALASEVFLEAGASSVYTGLSGLPLVRSREELERLRRGDDGGGPVTPSGFHPMGTCRMGSDPATSVVGPYGETHGVKGLFVADASVFPSCVGVNPQVTIMAFATRTARHILENSRRYLP
jgi:choline dehydrogenase-like flavoprotein